MIESIVYPFVCFCHLVPTSMVAVVCNVLSVCACVCVLMEGRVRKSCFFVFIITSNVHTVSGLLSASKMSTSMIRSHPPPGLHVLPLPSPWQQEEAYTMLRVNSRNTNKPTFIHIHGHTNSTAQADECLVNICDVTICWRVVKSWYCVNWLVFHDWVPEVSL